MTTTRRPKTVREEIEIPDQNDRIELGALCCLFNERGMYTALSDCGLTREHFYRERHKIVFTAQREAYEHGLYADGMLDAYAFSRELERRGLLVEVGEDYLLERVFEHIPTWRTIATYARQLDELLDVRKLKAAIAEAKEAARWSQVDEVRAILAKAAATPRGRETLKSAGLQVEDLVQQLIEETKGNPPGFESGFPRLDRIIGGFVPGRSYVLGGLTSVGKTAFALQCAVEVAKRKRVYVWSKEMHHGDCRRRLAALLAGVPLPTGALGRLNEIQQERVDGALKMLAELPIDIDDRPSTLPQMIAQARALRGDVGLFVVDHALLVSVPEARNEYAAVTEVSRVCKAHFAMECEAACLLLSQFSREAAREGNPKPHQLRGSGALEQDCDVGMTLTRKAYMKRDARDPEAELRVWKNRHGKTGSVPLEWDRKLARYVEPVCVEEGEEE
jgi:replicative DNA helicase